MSELQLAVFSVKDEIFGTDASGVSQIIKYQDVRKTSEMPDFVEGVINLRGEVIPVISLCRKLGMGETLINKKTKILLTEINGYRMGFAVDDVIKLAKFTDEEIKSLPGIIRSAGNSCIKNVGKKGEKLIGILDLKSVITADETDELKTKSGI